MTTAHILGLPHPPGNPLFVVVGRAWDLLTGFTGLPVALRINALGAYYTAYVSQGVSEELNGNLEAAEWAYRRANHFARLTGLALPSG